MGLRFLTTGESHGPALVAILEGMPAGLLLDIELINHELERRQFGYGSGPRMKIERDSVEILSGVMAGKTIGTPIALLINNHDHARWKGHDIQPFTIPRPGHADLSGTVKFGYHDLRPALERASARETAARVAVGAICKQFLKQFEIRVGGYVVSIGKVSTNLPEMSYEERFALAEQSEVRCPDYDTSMKMRQQIQEIINGRDTLGGVIEIVALGLPVGLGSYSQWDRRLDARLGAAILSVQAIKGVEIGTAFQNSTLPGTQVQDAILIEGERIQRASNRAGGLEGGITTGEPVVIRAAMKPIATTLTPQRSVDLANGKTISTQYERSDFCPVPRAVPILETMVAIILAESLIEKLGGDSMDEMLSRYKQLRTSSLRDLQMDNHPHLFWPAEKE